MFTPSIFWNLFCPLEELKLITFSVNEIEAELQSLKNSLINNNLLHSCTIRGVTNDWFQANDGVVGVKGIQFKMD